MRSTDEQWETLRTNASDIAIMIAAELSERTGITIDARDDAPDTWDALHDAYMVALIETNQLPIYSGHTDQTIYTTPEANIMGRFWHDMTHLTLRSDFTRRGETRVATQQYHEAVDMGVKLGLEFADAAQAALLIYRDTVAQVAYMERFGVFPDDQEKFMRDVWDNGTTIALMRVEVAA